MNILYNIGFCCAKCCAKGFCAKLKRGFCCVVINNPLPARVIGNVSRARAYLSHTLLSFQQRTKQHSTRVRISPLNVWQARIFILRNINPHSRFKRKWGAYFLQHSSFFDVALQHRFFGIKSNKNKSFINIFFSIEPS